MSTDERGEMGDIEYMDPEQIDMLEDLRAQQKILEQKLQEVMRKK